MKKMQRFPLLSGAQMKELRQSLFLTQKKLSELSGVSSLDICRMENGKSILSKYKFDRLYNCIMSFLDPQKN